jgi:hypothetical protein
LASKLFEPALDIMNQMVIVLTFLSRLKKWTERPSVSPLDSLILRQKANDNFFMQSQNFLIDSPRDGTPATSNRSCYDRQASSSFRITPYDSEQ